MLKILFVFLALANFCLAAEIEEFFVQSGDVRLFCRKLGEGDPLIVIHGGPGMTQDYLLPSMYRLAQNNLVVFYDQRGCGQSYCALDASTINLENYIEDIEQIRKALRIDKISILGHSWGGFLAMQYAIAYPQSIDKIILSNSLPASSVDLALYSAEWLQRMGPYLEEINDLHRNSGFEAGNPELIERLQRVMFKTYCYDPKKVNLLNLRMSATAALHGIQVFDLLHEALFIKPYSLFYDLYTLNIPTLVIHGDCDPIPSQTAAAIAEHITGSIYVLMKNCGHFPFVEEPDLYFHHIQDFLNFTPASFASDLIPNPPVMCE